MANIDHLVYAVPNLEKGIMKIERLFGVSPIYGGKHITKGTHNAILCLGDRTYLEIIAVDPENQSVTTEKWMGVATALGDGKLTRWALACENMAEKLAILHQFNPNLAKVEEGRRMRQNGEVLQWKMTLPLSSPQIEIAPFLLDWSNAKHPCEGLETQCSLLKLEATHPQPNQYKKLMQGLGFSITIQTSAAVSLQATIASSNGVVTLS